MCFNKLSFNMLPVRSIFTTYQLNSQTNQKQDFMMLKVGENEAICLDDCTIASDIPADAAVEIITDDIMTLIIGENINTDN